MLSKLWPAIVWAAIVLLLTGLPGNVFPEIKTFWDWLSPDKIVHLFIFGMLSFLIIWGYRIQYFKGEKRYILATASIITSSFYGLLTEVLQKYVFIGRSGNVYDFLADTIGAVLGWWIFTMIFRKKIHRSF
jgi:VanZ family protein